MVDALCPILQDVVTDKREFSLVGLNRIEQVVLDELFLVVSNKRADGLNAG
jgi:hypothetical protein